MKKGLFLLIALLLVGCGTIKKTKDVFTEKVVSSVKEDTHTVITETIDTVIHLQENNVTATGPLQYLLDGGVIHATNGITSVEVSYDKVTGKVKAKGTSELREVPVKGTKVTEIDSSRETDTKTKSKEETITKERKDYTLPLMIFIIGVVLLVAIYIDRKILTKN